jgi:hypothetical protein
LSAVYVTVPIGTTVDDLITQGMEPQQYQCDDFIGVLFC